MSGHLVLEPLRSTPTSMRHTWVAEWRKNKMCECRGSGETAEDALIDLIFRMGEALAGLDAQTLRLAGQVLDADAQIQALEQAAHDASEERRSQL